MNQPGSKPIALMIALLLGFGVVFSQTAEPRNEFLPNFHKVNERLYRGAQPKSEGLKKLAELGVKTILNLRGESAETRHEEARAKSLGLQYYSIPMSGLGQPTEAQIKRALQIIDASENAPVFIHCQRGSDRTGVIVAVYRMTRDGWTADQALDEANRFGMGFIQFQKREYIKEYFRDLQRAEHSAGAEKAGQEIR